MALDGDDCIEMCRETREGGLRDEQRQLGFVLVTNQTKVNTSTDSSIYTILLSQNDTSVTSTRRHLYIHVHIVTKCTPNPRIVNPILTS